MGRERPAVQLVVHWRRPVEPLNPARTGVPTSQESLHGGRHRRRRVAAPHSPSATATPIGVIGSGTAAAGKFRYTTPLLSVRPDRGAENPTASNGRCSVTFTSAA